jgi:hypothetical protein
LKRQLMHWQRSYVAKKNILKIVCALTSNSSIKVAPFGRRTPQKRGAV